MLNVFTKPRMTRMMLTMMIVVEDSVIPLLYDLNMYSLYARFIYFLYINVKHIHECGIYIHTFIYIYIYIYIQYTFICLCIMYIVYIYKLEIYLHIHIWYYDIRILF